MAEPADFGALARRFQSLRQPDRRAVLASFSPNDRALFEQALAEQTQADREEEERRQRTDKQFHGYSPWLADVITEALADPNATSRMAPRAAKALAAQHQVLLENSGQADQGGILAIARHGWRVLMGEQAGRAR